LLVFHRDGTQIFPLEPQESVVIGRGEAADLCISDKSLSKEHARLDLSSGTATLSDLTSTNGTFVNGARIERATLAAGDELAFGGVLAHLLALGKHPPVELEGDDLFRVHVERERVRAAHFGRTFAVLFCTVPAHLTRFVGELRPRLAPVDHLALYSANAVEILLPEADRRRATELASTLSATDPKIRVRVSMYPEDAQSTDALLSREPPAVAPKSFAVESDLMRALYDTAARVARTIIPVLITGETGAGKEVLARHIALSSPRKDAPFIALNCAAIPKQLIEATLFGHEKGAFTGATERRKGAFESAHRGTLFLDEIGELSAEAQAALLRVLETKKLNRVGSTDEISADVRVLAATHRDLEALSNSGEFRQDLYYRLNAVTLEVPPLRDRRSEIPGLASLFLERAREQHGTSARAFDAAAVEALSLYSWPGNIRELRNVVDRSAVLARDELISFDELPPRIKSVAPELDTPDTSTMLREKMLAHEAELIRDALQKTGGNQTEAARLLGLPRRTLVHKLRMHRESSGP
jgi:DNA-binding NtrC family response regulator